MGGISLPLALLGMQAMLGTVVQAQYNVYYGYTAQELQEFIADTVMPFFCVQPIFNASISGDRHGGGRDGLRWRRLPLQVELLLFFCR